MNRSYQSPDFATLAAAVEALSPQAMLFSSSPVPWQCGSEDFNRVVSVYASPLRVGGDGVVRDLLDGSRICTLLFDALPEQLAGQTILAGAPSLLDLIAHWEAR